MIATFVTAAGLGVLGVTWVGYPAWLALRARGAPRPLRLREGTPREIVVVCVARDEAGRIEGRLEELAALRLPEGARLRVVVVDDGSRDGTGEQARAWAGRSTLPVEVLRGEGGKAAGLALALRGVAEAVVVFCDVRQRVPSEALLPLLEALRDPAVGVVSGVVAKPATGPGGWYWRYETWVRRMEARSGSTIGATGPWYAARAEALAGCTAGLLGEEPLLLDDVFLPLCAALAGWRVVVAERAVVHDVEHPAAVEARKKARTLAGNLQLLGRVPLGRVLRSEVGGRFVMHKVMRLATPWAVAALVVGPALGALTPGPLQAGWAAVLAAEGVAGGAALAGSARAREAARLVGASVAAWGRWRRRDWRW